MKEHEEEQLLRAVTLQNARSIFLARQRAEEELLRTAEALRSRTDDLAHALAMIRATLEATTDGILVTDAGGRVTGLNDRFAAMWRLPRGAVEGAEHRALAKTTSRQVADPAAYLARIGEIYSGIGGETHDVIELTEDRVFERTSRIQQVLGRDVGRVWSFRDVTERRRAEDALRKQSEWWRVTVASVGDAVMTTDPQGRVLSLNGVAQALTGWSDDEARGRMVEDVFRIVVEGTRLPAGNPVAAALREGRVVGLAGHAVLVARDGTETPVDDSAAPIRDAAGAVQGVVLVFRAIAERRAAEVALRRSARELEDFFDNAPVGLRWIGPDGVILRANRAELDLLGCSREEYVGHHFAEFLDDPDLGVSMLSRLSDGEALEGVPVAMRRTDGTLRHVLVDANVLWDDARFVHARCITRAAPHESDAPSPA